CVFVSLPLMRNTRSEPSKGDFGEGLATGSEISTAAWHARDAEKSSWGLRKDTKIRDFRSVPRWEAVYRDI
ncbi:MAG TPA: hypothetical protein VF031_09485, partial [Alphaproteobacteria bacterium]